MQLHEINGVINAVEISGIDLRTADAATINTIKQRIYQHKIVVIKNQPFSDKEYVDAASKFGQIETYFQSNYHHPDYPEIFVSSSVKNKGKKIGVKGTGRYWHCDYQFFRKPFSFVFIRPVLLQGKGRKTLYVDMEQALSRITPEMHKQVYESICIHDPKMKYKIQEGDIDKAIDELIAEVSKLAPPLRRKTVVPHPVTGKDILFMSPGFTHGLEGLNDEENALFMERLFAEVLDEEQIFSYEWSENDLLIWDNVSLIHSSGAAVPGDYTTHRLTVYDDAPGACPDYFGDPDAA